jgi:predicted enzyme related to lactoylglutathione lyase
VVGSGSEQPSELSHVDAVEQPFTDEVPTGSRSYATRTREILGSITYEASIVLGRKLSRGVAGGPRLASCRLGCNPRASSERGGNEMLQQARVAAIVPVSDVEAAIRFYGDTLGLRLKERRSDLPENREAEFEAGDGTLLVYESVGAGQSRHTVAGFRVDDIEAVVSSLRERGVVFEEYDLPDLKTENGIAAVGDVRAAWCKDPDGNILAVESV